jgi:hypothetical protein
MAATVIPLVTLTAFNTSATNGTALALDATLGGYLTPTKKDGKVLVMLINNDSGNATTCTINIGNGLQGTGSDITVSLAASETEVICLETGRFLNVSGTNKGKIFFEDAAADTKVIAYELP